MKEINTDALLMQLRANAALAQNNLSNVGATQAGASVESQGPNFSNLLQQSIDKVNELQKTSSQLGQAFEIGDANVSIAEVMIAKQKAGIAFQSVLQVRNKLSFYFNPQPLACGQLNAVKYYEYTNKEQ